MSNAPFGQTPEPQAPAAQAEAQPTLADVMSAVSGLKAEVDGRLKTFGSDLGRIREKLKVPASADASQAVAPPQAQAQQAQAPGLSMADLNAALALGEIRGKLPEPAKARIASMLEQGRSYSDALSFAEALAESLSTGAANAPNQPGAAIAPPVSFTGRAAMAAQSPAVGYPRTKSDLLALSKASPEKFKAVMADPNFDPDTLPMR